MNFSDLALAEPLSRAIAEKGYDTPTPIQQAAIPPALAGNDVLGLAQTGTGKTAAFALPILNRLAANPKHRLKLSTRVLVLAPTRELAAQIAASFTAYGRYLKLSVACVFGGVPIGRQERALFPGVDVLVATPGRLLDLVMKGACDLGHVEMLVLDECDQMLDLGFVHDLKRITGLLPKQRQSMLFSATLPPTIEDMAQRYLKNPIKVAVKPAATTAERVVQTVIHVSQPEKLALLAHLLVEPDVGSAIVFTRTKHGADRVVRQLSAHKIAAEAIHGNRSQAQRTRALTGFRTGEVKVLVATDIAARGLDIPAVSHIFNYELPNVPEQYVHRIGRTARAGREGRAIALCAPDERAFLKDIERTIRMQLDQQALPGARGGSPLGSASTNSMPDVTSPHTVYWRSRKRASSKQMKNWLLALFGALVRAIEQTPRTCGTSLNSAFRSGRSLPPVPVPLGQPPCAMKLGMTR